MSTLNGLLAEFESASDLVAAAKKTHGSGYSDIETYSPFPVHGLGAAIGFTKNRVPLVVLLGGIVGACTGYGLQYWVSAITYPINVGGRPLNSWPSFVIITFELTVLFASVGMVLTFCYLCQVAPFVKKDHFNPRSTDDTFVLALECNDKTNEQEAIAFLNSLGAKEVNVQYKETGWWLGRYDKDTKRFERKTEAVH